MKHNLTLEYNLGEGWLAPWVAGLRKGEAAASTCNICDAAYFPPLRVCSFCGTQTAGWRKLGGGATILMRTTGSDGDFALVQFDGAASAAVVRTDTLTQAETRGVLKPIAGGLPALHLISEPEE